MRAHPIPVLCLSLLPLAACGYRIEGHAVSGGFGSMTWVDSADPRLQARGVPGVRIQLVRDPDRMRREVVAEATSSEDGSFILETRTFGAGWMDERWEITASRTGFGATTTRIELPVDPSGRHLLVEMDRGGGGPVRPEASSNLFDEAARWDPSIQRKPSAP